MRRRELLRMQVRFPPDVHQWLRAQAERNMSSINAEIIRCVRDAMDRQVPCTTPPHDRSGNGS
jgi:predicted HicB family RNase H-like nuclease